MVRPLSCLILTLPLLAAAAQPPQRPANTQILPSPVPAESYADLADLALPATTVAHVRLRRASPLRPEEATGVAPGHSRFYMETEAVALIRGQPEMSTQVKYLVDLPNDANGRPARPARRAEWLVFGRAVAGRPGELQLTAPDAQIAYSPAAAERIRAILREALSPDAPPSITGVGRAFHVPGVLPGSSETQIFFQTARNQPISLTILREPGIAPAWFVSLSEFVDAGATQPQRDTLLWYRLACALPPQLPRASMAESAEHAQAITADYSLVRQGLGACERRRVRR